MGCSEALWLDADILVDFLAQRMPWYPAAQAIIDRADLGEWEIWFSPLTLANVFYVYRKIAGTAPALKALKALTGSGQIPNLTAAHVLTALASGHFDFEDELQIACATSAGVTAIITRNLPDYRHAPIPVMTAEQWLQEHPPATP